MKKKCKSQYIASVKTRAKSKLRSSITSQVKSNAKGMSIAPKCGHL